VGTKWGVIWRKLGLREEGFRCLRSDSRSGEDFVERDGRDGHGGTSGYEVACFTVVKILLKMLNAT
jgi:hypothetical protein